MSEMPQTRGGAARTEEDPITFEVVRSSLVNVVSEMGVRLARVAFSPVIADGRDYSLAMFAPNGDMICTGPMDLPAHVGTLEFSARCVLDAFPPDKIEEGDVFFLNEPHKGGTHFNDMRVVHPVFVDGELLVWLIACGHWADVGGPCPGSFNAGATSSFGEGLRVPPVRLVRGGELNQDLVEVVLANVRLYHQSRGDLQAALEACKSGEARLLDICRNYGVDTVRGTARRMMDHAEALLLTQTGELADGTYEWTDWVDIDLPAQDPQPYKVNLKLEIEDGKLTFDYRGSDPQPVGPSGSSLPMTWSATVCGVLNLFPGVPFNHGVSRNMEVLTEAGSCVDVQFPGAISGTAAGVYEKVLACVMHCIGQADPTKRSAAAYNLVNVTLGGTDERGMWVMYLWPAGGFGGTPRGDGGLPSMMLYSAGSRNQPIEVMERAYPVLFEKMGMKEDSMGAGFLRGGAGIEMVLRPTGGRTELTAIGDRHRFPIWGVDGGLDGSNQDIVAGEGESARSLSVNVAGEFLPTGERVHLWTGGGGGFGHPFDRDPDLVLEDVIEGLVSIDAARDDYGVAVEAVDTDVCNYQVDGAATRRLRESRRETDGEG